MLILTIRTDKPEAELGLFDDEKQLAYSAWQAHRELAETLHARLKQSLTQTGKEFQDIKGIVIFKGPGSFIGLRIGFAVANALANSLAVPVVSELIDEQWIEKGTARLREGKNETVALPEYGALPNITAPKH